MKWIGAFTDNHEQRTMTEKLEGLVTQRTKELQRPTKTCSSLPMLPPTT
jgi:hypothetical protein